jgi:hypothetical protein
MKIFLELPLNKHCKYSQQIYRSPLPGGLPVGWKRFQVRSYRNLFLMERLDYGSGIIAALFRSILGRDQFFLEKSYYIFRGN